MPEQRVINLDSQILNGIQLCARRTELQFVRNLQPPDKAVALEKGDLMHKMFEIHDGLSKNLARPESDTWLMLKDIGIFPINDLAREEILRIMNVSAPFFASKMGLDPAEVEETIYQVQEYLKFYKDDPWSTLAVEEVGTKLLHEDEFLKILYSGKIDRIRERGNQIVPFDYKSSKRRTDPTSLSNQFIGYCFLLNSNHMIVDKVGFQKTLKPQERFTRDLLTYNADRIEEWRENTVWWARMLDFHMQSDFYPMNWTSCDKYSGCIFKNICETTKENREMKIERDYRVGPHWDVAKILEAEVGK